jgi:hypothetical protein
MVVQEHVCGVELDKAGVKVKPRSKFGDKGQMT